MPIPADAVPGEFPLTSDTPTVVLDTNVVFDWLVFREPAVSALVRAMESAQVVWRATAQMRAEFEHVLARGLAARRSVDAVAALAAWDRHARLADALSVMPTLRCTDPDDQKFIDLSLACRARWLVSRDRAVLKLRRRALPLGLAILPPEQWSLRAP